jgi:hypothetical protein
VVGDLVALAVAFFVLGESIIEFVIVDVLYGVAEDCVVGLGFS